MRTSYKLQSITKSNTQSENNAMGNVYHVAFSVSHSDTETGKRLTNDWKCVVQMITTDDEQFTRSFNYYVRDRFASKVKYCHEFMPEFDPATIRMNQRIIKWMTKEKLIYAFND